MDLNVSHDEVDLEVLVACCLDDLLFLTAVGGFVLEARRRLHCRLDRLLLVVVLLLTGLLLLTHWTLLLLLLSLDYGLNWSDDLFPILCHRLYHLVVHLLLLPWIAYSRVSTLSESWLQLKLQGHVELEVEVVVVVEGAVCLE